MDVFSGSNARISKPQGGNPSVGFAEDRVY